jgi:hypothetical protein
MFIVADTTTKEIIAGPCLWDKRFFQTKIFQKKSIEVQIPYANPVGKVIEYAEANVTIYPCDLRQKPNVDLKYEKMIGPLFEFDDENQKFIEYYQKKDLSLDEIKTFFKHKIKLRRKFVESQSMKVELSNGTTYLIPVDKQNRSVFLTGAPGLWKMKRHVSDNDITGPETETDWVNLTQEDLDTIVSSIRTRINRAFLTEKHECDIIDSFENVSDAASYDLDGYDYISEPFKEVPLLEL